MIKWRFSSYKGGKFFPSKQIIFSRIVEFFVHGGRKSYSPEKNVFIFAKFFSILTYVNLLTKWKLIITLQLFELDKGKILGFPDLLKKIRTQSFAIFARFFIKLCFVQNLKKRQITIKSKIFRNNLLMWRPIFDHFSGYSKSSFYVWFCINC